MNYPSPALSPDTKFYNFYNSKQGRAHYDSGILIDIHYDIVDGKRVFKKFAGVNKSMTII